MHVIGPCVRRVLLLQSVFDTLWLFVTGLLTCLYSSDACGESWGLERMDNQ